MILRKLIILSGKISTGYLKILDYISENNSQGINFENHKYQVHIVVWENKWNGQRNIGSEGISHFTELWEVKCDDEGMPIQIIDITMITKHLKYLAEGKVWIAQATSFVILCNYVHLGIGKADSRKWLLFYFRYWIQLVSKDWYHLPN